jgi:hypothetical protein
MKGRADNLALNVAAELPCLYFGDGDTLVFFDPPDGASLKDSMCGLFARPPYRIHSSKIFATGSDVLMAMFNPTKQYRITRRYKCQPLPAGVKYVLDLTPPEEGDEAVALITELSCSMGIRKWHMAADTFQIDAVKVCGKDTLKELEAERELEEFRERLRAPKAPDTEKKVLGDDFDEAMELGNGENKKLGENAVGANSKAANASPPLDAKAVHSEIGGMANMPSNKTPGPAKGPMIPLDYSAARHRSGIERILYAIEGLDPKIDSAPKAWTLFVLSKFFDCTATVVDWIIPWIYFHPNYRFIEVLPEVSFKIAEGFRNYSLARDAFSVLVGEEALHIMCKYLGQVNPPIAGRSELGREKEDVKEDLQTRVEYASKSLADKVVGSFHDLMKPEAWFCFLKEYRKVVSAIQWLEVSPRTPNYINQKSSIEKLCQSLRNRVCWHILTVLCQLDLFHDATPSQHSIESTKNGDCFPNRPIKELILNLHPKAKLLTRPFWLALRHRNFGDPIGLMTDLIDSPETRHMVENDFNVSYSLAHNVYDAVDNFNMAMSSTSVADVGGNDQHSLCSIRSRLCQPLPNATTNEELIALGMNPTIGPTDAISYHGGWPRFDILVFWREVNKYVFKFCGTILSHDMSIDVNVTETLVCLGPEEWKLLPLWAGGNDDDSGGVFQSDLPPAVPESVSLVQPIHIFVKCLTSFWLLYPGKPLTVAIATTRRPGPKVPHMPLFESIYGVRLYWSSSRVNSRFFYGS